MSKSNYLPGYRPFCTAVGLLYVALGLSMVLRGARAAMEPFAVPESVLGSAHFADFFHWVFVHMMVLGLLITLLGRLVEGGCSQQIVARVLLVAHAHYAYLDLRTSDSAFGNGLYRGASSLVPASIDLLVTLGFLYLSLRSLRASDRSRSLGTEPSPVA